MSPKTVVCDMYETPLTWQQMANRGLVALEEDCNGCFRVILSYIALQQILTCSKPPPHAHRHLTYLVLALRHIPESTLLTRICGKNGSSSYFHCLRINAYLCLGYEQILLRYLYYGDKDVDLMPCFPGKNVRVVTSYGKRCV